jgi:hypothetical protein
MGDTNPEPNSFDDFSARFDDLMQEAHRYAFAQ